MDTSDVATEPTVTGQRTRGWRIAAEELTVPQPDRNPKVPTPVVVAGAGIASTLGLAVAGTVAPGNVLRLLLVVGAVTALVAMATATHAHRARADSLQAELARVRHDAGDEDARRRAALEGERTGPTWVDGDAEGRARPSPPRASDRPATHAGPGARPHPPTLLADSRRQLVAWASDDLRTPLARLQATATALEEGVIDQPIEVAAALAVMSREIEEVAGLVGDLHELHQGTTTRNGGDPVLVVSALRPSAPSPVDDLAPVHHPPGAVEPGPATFDAVFRAAVPSGDHDGAAARGRALR